jgi:hypothetical protein
MMTETMSATVPMMMNCDRQLTNSGRVTAAMPGLARKFAPTGPQVQKANAVERPIREKSRTRLAVVVTAAPPTNSSTDRTIRS